MNALCGQSRSSSTLSGNKDPVGAMFRKAVREGLVRAGRVACDLFADCATSDADDIMIHLGWKDTLVYCSKSSC